MIIEKNFDMKIKVDTDIVSKYLNEVPNIKDSEKELDDLIDKCDPAALKYFVARYMQKLKSDSPEDFDSFIGKTEEPVVEKSIKDKPKRDRELRSGDSIFIKDTDIGFGLFNTNMWTRYEVQTIKVAGSEQSVYFKSRSNGSLYRLDIQRLAEMKSRGLLYISYADKEDL